jgi:hypothetical protein
MPEQKTTLTDVNPSDAMLTDAELDAVTGGSVISSWTKIISVLHDMNKAMIDNYRV